MMRMMTRRRRTRWKKMYRHYVIHDWDSLVYLHLSFSSLVDDSIHAIAVAAVVAAVAAVCLLLLPHGEDDEGASLLLSLSLSLLL
jgi:hypothetical protein